MGRELRALGFGGRVRDPHLRGSEAHAGLRGERLDQSGRKLDEGMRDDTKWNEDEMIAHTRFSIGCIKEIVPEFFKA